MPQSQPPVTPVTTTRNTVAPAGTRSSNNGAIVYGPCVAPAGPASGDKSSRYKPISNAESGKANKYDTPSYFSRRRDIGTQPSIRMENLGGQHCASIGTSTHDLSDRETDAAALADFTAAWETIKFGTLAGSEW